MQHVTAERLPVEVDRQAPPIPPTSRSGSTRRWLGAGIAYGALLLLALTLRLYGLNFGLPQVGYYWDEPTVVNHAVRFGSGDFNPHWFYYPALFMYLVFGAIGLYGLIGLGTGRFKSIDEFAVQYFLDPSHFYLVARSLSVLFGVLSVLLIVRLGQRHLSPLAGWLAGLFLAVSVLHSSQSHIAVTDIALTFFFLAVCWPLLRIVQEGRRRDYLLAGLLIGLGMATKYFTILAVPSLVLAHLLANGRPLWPQSAGRWLADLVSPRLLTSLVAILVGFFIGSPYNLLDLRSFLADGREQYEVSSQGEELVARLYLLNTLPSDLGWPLLLAALVGLPLILVRLKRTGLVLLSVPFCYLVFMLIFPRGFARYMVPLSPFLALIAAFAVASGFQALARRLPATRQSLAAGGLALVVTGLIALPTYSNLRWNMVIAHQTDPRTATIDWLQATIPAETPISIQSLYGKTYLNAPVLTDRRLDEIKQDIPATGRFGRVRQQVLDSLGGGHVYREIEFVYDLERLRAAGVRYIITSNQNWLKVLDGRAPSDSPEMRFKRDLDAQARIVAVFAPADDLSDILRFSPIRAFPYLEPTITIYELPARA